MGVGFTSDETTPGLMAFMNDFGGIFLVLGLAREGKGVFRFTIGNFVDPTFE